MEIKIEDLDTKEMLEEASLYDKLQSGDLHVLSENPITLEVTMKKPKSARVKLSVKMLETNIYKSPILFHFSQEANKAEDTLEENKVEDTLGDNGSEIDEEHDISYPNYDLDTTESYFALCTKIASKGWRHYG